MPVTINGSGTLEGLSAGGLPDASVTASELAAGAINAQALALLNASGAAPVFAARAWVNFNGTGTVAIRGSGNVSSITDNGVGDYTVNFATAMVDTNYAVEFGSSNGISSLVGVGFIFNSTTAPANSTVRVGFVALNSSSQPLTDASICSIAIFR